METLELTDKEQDIANEVVNIAIAKAADMLSFFVKQKVMAEKSKISFEPFSEKTLFTSMNSERIVVLKTEVRGEFTGNCYLLFTQEQKEKVLRLTLPPLVYSNEKLLKEQGKAILLEMDNIISASVISQFANLLKLQMYGYVPRFNEIKAEDVNGFLYEENKSNSVLLRIKTKLSTENDKLEPEFVWFLDKDVFISGIKKLSQ